MDATMVPGEGAPGSTTAAPANPMAETIPTNPATIAQSTSINTLDQILCANWIYDSTFTVSTSQAPGTIVYYKKIHPRGWNWANTHVSAMFNCYTGSGSVRYRPVATVWYGGSIRVGFLPPSIAEEDISKIPIEVLTTYPNRDIDPKNTGWVQFSPPDERNIAYHYMDDTGRQSFGGYVVFYVAARLVTQSPEFTTINILVETKGGFMFDQPNPNVLSRVVSLDHPLVGSTKVPLSDHRMPAGLTNAPDFIQISPNTTTVLHYPGTTHAAFGTPNAVLPQSSINIRGITKTNVDLVDPDGFCLSFDETENRFVGAAQTEGESSSKITEEKPTSITITGNTYTFQYSGSELPEGRFVPYRQFTAPKDAEPKLVYTTDVGNLRKIDGLTIPTVLRERANESVVTFINLYGRVYSSQTSSMRDDLEQFKDQGPNSRLTYLYQVITETGTPILTLRLWPSGLLTTNGASAYQVLPITRGMKLRYLNTLNADDPLPSASATYHSIKPLLTGLANGKVSAEDVETELKFL